MKRRLLPILLVLAAAVFVITHFMWIAQMPERVASHFNAAGKPNGWMTRGQHSGFMLLFGLGEPAFVLTLIWAMKFLPANLLNVPKPDYWRAPENYPKACAIMLTWAQTLAVAMLIWNTFFNRLIIKANLISPPHLANTDIWPLTVVFVIMIAGSIAWLIWRFRQTDDATPAHSAPPPTAAGS